MACFGMVTRTALPAYHYFIMRSILDHPLVLAGVLVLWLLYNTQCFLFCKQILASAEGMFLFELQCFSIHQQGLLFLAAHLVLLLPFLVYTAVFIAVALTGTYFIQAAAVLLFWLSIIGLCVRGYLRMLNCTWKPAKPVFKFFQITITFNKNLHFILLYYIHHERKVIYLLLKGFSFLLLYLLLIWNENGFGRDFFVMIFQLMLLAHTPAAYDCFRFTENKLLFFRNLPLRTITIAGHYLFTYLILLLPELLFLLIKQPGIFSKTDLSIFYLIAAMTLFLLTAILYSENLGKEELFKIVFMLFFIATFALNGGYCYVWLCIITSIAAVLFFRNYHTFSRAA